MVVCAIDEFGRIANTLKNRRVCVTGQDILTNVIMYRVRDAVSRDACGERKALERHREQLLPNKVYKELGRGLGVPTTSFRGKTPRYTYPQHTPCNCPQ